MALIILDRDGVINYDSDNYIRSVEQWIAIPGSIAAISRLSQAGHSVAIATNQSGLARGYYDEQELQAMHEKMCGLLAASGGQIDHIAHCPHLPDDGCACRKPKPGMLLDTLRHFDISAAETVFIGDSYSDFQAAQAAGTRFALVKTGKGERTLAAHPELHSAAPVFGALNEFVVNYLDA